MDVVNHEFALEMVGVGKSFPGTLAVDSVDFAVRRGEIHALLGENGAGKSTLMKVLAGSFSYYTGEIRIAGTPVALHSPAVAKRLGIQMIHQELDLSPPQSIAENLLAGRLPRKAGLFVDRRKLAEASERHLARLGLQLDASRPVEDLSQHEAQLVEIAKALGSEPSILVMDEPTSALTRDDVEILFALMRRLRDQGLAIVYISHHLSEVFQVADRASVMRDGKLIATKDLHETTQAELVQLMVGRELAGVQGHARALGGDALTASALTRNGFFRDVSFNLQKGEVVGLCGLAGSGRSELARSICGIDPLHAGALVLDGQNSTIRSYQSALKHGVAYLTEDRKLQGLALRLDVRDNVLSATLGQPTRPKSGILTELMDALRISPPNPRQLVGNLSGGNQQKVLLAKWLAIEPKVIILDEPTRGVDVGAKAIIHKAILNLASQGKAVLLISSDLLEIATLSDRILVMRKGRLIGELPKDHATEESLLLAANGVLEGAA